MVEEVQNHIGGLNWGYRVALREKNVTYLNEYATFVDKNTVVTTNKKGKEKTVTAAKFILATGGRPRCARATYSITTTISITITTTTTRPPRYPAIPGAELAISSDDLFSLPHAPGKVRPRTQVYFLRGKIRRKNKANPSCGILRPYK